MHKIVHTLARKKDILLQRLSLLIDTKVSNESLMNVHPMTLNTTHHYQRLTLIKGTAFSHNPCHQSSNFESLLISSHKMGGTFEANLSGPNNRLI